MSDFDSSPFSSEDNELAAAAAESFDFEINHTVTASTDDDDDEEEEGSLGSEDNAMTAEDGMPEAFDLAIYHKETASTEATDNKDEEEKLSAAGEEGGADDAAIWLKKDTIDQWVEWLGHSDGCEIGQAEASLRIVQVFGHNKATRIGTAHGQKECNDFGEWIEESKRPKYADQDVHFASQADCERWMEKEMLSTREVLRIYNSEWWSGVKSRSHQRDFHQGRPYGSQLGKIMDDGDESFPSSDGDDDNQTQSDDNYWFNGSKQQQHCQCCNKSVRHQRFNVRNLSTCGRTSTTNTSNKEEDVGQELSMVDVVGFDWQWDESEQKWDAMSDVVDPHDPDMPSSRRHLKAHIARLEGNLMIIEGSIAGTKNALKKFREGTLQQLAKEKEIELVYSEMGKDKAQETITALCDLLAEWERPWEKTWPDAASLDLLFYIGDSYTHYENLSVNVSRLKADHAAEVDRLNAEVSRLKADRAAEVAAEVAVEVAAEVARLKAGHAAEVDRLNAEVSRLNAEVSRLKADRADLATAEVARLTAAIPSGQDNKQSEADGASTDDEDSSEEDESSEAYASESGTGSDGEGGSGEDSIHVDWEFIKAKLLVPMKNRPSKGPTRLPTEEELQPLLSKARGKDRKLVDMSSYCKCFSCPLKNCRRSWAIKPDTVGYDKLLTYEHAVGNGNSVKKVYPVDYCKKQEFTRRNCNAYDQFRDHVPDCIVKATKAQFEVDLDIEEVKEWVRAEKFFK